MKTTDRKTGQTGPAWNTFPRLEALAFVCADGQFICCDCANGRNGSLANIDGSIAEAEKLHDQWRIIGAQFNDEPHHCSHCNFLIPSLKNGKLPKFKTE